MLDVKSFGYFKGLDNILSFAYMSLVSYRKTKVISDTNCFKNDVVKRYH